MSRCARPNCEAEADSSCSRCGREQYCGSVCQKLDWKAHRLICPTLQKLSKKLQPYPEVCRILEQINHPNESNERVLNHLLSYVEHQFGQPVAGLDYRERDGVGVSNWDVDIRILLQINKKISGNHGRDQSLSNTIRDDKMIPYLVESLRILKPWLVHLDSHVNNRVDSLNNDQKNQIIYASYVIEHKMAIVLMSRNQLELAQGHCQQCLTYAKMYRLKVEDEEKRKIYVEEKIGMVHNALSTNIELLRKQEKNTDAVKFAEDAYNLVVEAYDCVHPKVQEAAGRLINCLIPAGDLVNAERFAEQTYANLRDHKNGMDQEGEDVAQGSHNFALVLFKQGKDLIKAEELGREGLRLKDRLFGAGHITVGVSCLLLADILSEQGKLGDETKELYERSLAIFIRNEGPVGLNHAVANQNMGRYYHTLAGVQLTTALQRKELLLAKYCAEESIRIFTELFSPTHPVVLKGESFLSNVLHNIRRTEHANSSIS